MAVETKKTKEDEVTLEPGEVVEAYSGSGNFQTGLEKVKHEISLIQEKAKVSEDKKELFMMQFAPILQFITYKSENDVSFETKLLMPHKSFVRCYSYIEKKAMELAKAQGGANFFCMDGILFLSLLEEYYNADDKLEVKKDLIEQKKKADEAEKRKKAADKKSSKKTKDKPEEKKEVKKETEEEVVKAEPVEVLKEEHGKEEFDGDVSEKVIQDTEREKPMETLQEILQTVPNNEPVAADVKEADMPKEHQEVNFITNFFAPTANEKKEGQDLFQMSLFDYI